MIGIILGVVIIYAFTFLLVKAGSDADDYMLGDKQYKWFKFYEGGAYMTVFYITVRVFGLEFRQPVYGKKSDYTENELREIMERYKKETRLKLYALGYVG